MLRRAQLALALILLLVLTPLAGATCGIACMSTIPHSMHAASSQRQCVRAACCHSSGAALCSVTSASDITAALVTDIKAPHDTAANAAIAAEFLPQNSRAIAVRGVDSSPPGQPRAVNPIPLRV